ncbi:MAG: hypothetical protein ABSC31_14880 [Acidimicrobiales bacterium]
MEKVAGDQRAMAGDQRALGVLVEKIASDQQAMAEAISVLPRMDDRQDRMEGRLDYIEADVAEIKVYVAGHHEAIIELKAASNTH